MSIQASPEQCGKIGTLPVSHCFVFHYGMTREISDIAPWYLLIKFVMAAYDTESKHYFPVLPIRTIEVRDIELLARLEAADGKLDLALSMEPFQVGLAHIIRSQCTDLSTAAFVTVA